MGKLKRFLDYWWTAVTNARKQYTMLVWLIPAVLWITVKLLQPLGVSSSGILFLIDAQTTNTLETLTLGALLLWVFAWCPFSKHDELEQKLTDEIRRLKEKKKSMSVRTDARNFILSQKEQDAEGYECSCWFILHNDGTVSVEDVRLEIVDLFNNGDGRKDVLGPIFPIRVAQADFDVPANANPSQSIEFTFLRPAKTVEMDGARFIHGSIMSLGRQLGFKVGEEYPITFRISAKDMEPIIQKKKLIFEGGHPSMGLR